MFKRPSEIATLCLVITLSLTPISLRAQALKSSGPPAAGSRLTTEKVMELAQQGRCKETLPTLKRAMTGPSDADIKKKVGLLGVRCAMDLDDREAAINFLRQLLNQFPQDPEVLFVTVHVYSDLSTRAAQELGRVAPQSIPARKLFAESFELQGKWGDAQREYEAMIEKEPNAAGLHFLLGRLLLSRPDADAGAAQRAKEEFQRELEVDPKNAGAHFVLGELASKDEKWDEAIAQFSETVKLDPNFAEAYLGWGFALVSLKRYQEAIAPLRVAERLTPANPAIHYSLATALTRTGQKEEADKEFAIHRGLTATTPTPLGGDKPQ